MADVDPAARPGPSLRGSEDDEAAAPKLRGPWYGHVRRAIAYVNSILFTLVAIGVLLSAHVIAQDLWGRQYRIGWWLLPVPEAPSWRLVTSVVVAGALVGVLAILRASNLTRIQAGVAWAVIAIWACLTPKEVTTESLSVFAIALAAIAATYSIRNSFSRRSPGYFWVLPAIGLFLFATLRTLHGGGSALVITTVGVLLGALGCRVFYRFMTPAWGLGLFTVALIGTATAVSIDAGSMLVPVTLAAVLPIALVPIIGANVTPRTALITMVLMALLSLGVLAAVGAANEPVRPETGKPCATDGTPQAADGADETATSACSPMALASYGWSYLVREWASRPFREVRPRTEHPPKVPLSRNMFLAIGVAYLYLCHRVLRFSGERLRDTIDLHEVQADGEPAKHPSPALQEVLLSGAVTVGAASPDVGSTGGMVTTIASALPTNFIARAIEAVFTRVPMRATVTRSRMPTDRPDAPQRPEEGKAPENPPAPPDAPGQPAAPAGLLGEDDDPVAVLIEHPAYREARLALEVREPHPLIEDVTPIRLAGFSILAYSLSARGMPAWATWNFDGVGLGAWYQSREARRSRQRKGRQGTRHGVQSELAMLRGALDDHDPRSLLLMLEIASRYYETRRYDLAVKYLLRAVNDYPEFPETWLRLSLAYTRLGSAMADGYAPKPEPASRSTVRRPVSGILAGDQLDHGLSHLWERSSIEVGARSASYRHWANETIRLRVAETVGDQASTTDRIRNAEAVVRSQVLARAAAIGTGDATPEDGDDRVVPRSDLLASHFTHLGVACAEECQRRLLRARLISRCLLVQSQRTFLWSLLISRFGVRRLSAAARSAEILARTYSLEHDELDDEAFQKTVAVMRQRLTSVYQSVDREGTGWRAPWYLAEAHAKLPRPEGTEQELLSGLTAKQIEDRTRTLETLGERRCRAERAWDPHWLEPTQIRPMPLRTIDPDGPIRKGASRRSARVWPSGRTEGTDQDQTVDETAGSE